ncbi:MAG: preprotein translocase subunit SecG [Rhodospirillales bacterium]|nr:preprotein translocase subunit SecG [Rhodospirillales bacterium]
MITVVIVIHLLISIALIVLVLLQRSEGGGLGIGGGGGGGGFMTARGTANLLTRATAVLAAVFMVTSLVLVMLAGGGRERGPLIDAPPAAQQPASPAPAGESPPPAAPASPAPPIAR